MVETTKKEKKKTKFEIMLWKQLKEEYVYEQIPLFNGAPNPETGKKENLHTLMGEHTIFSYIESIDE